LGLSLFGSGTAHLIDSASFRVLGIVEGKPLGGNCLSKNLFTPTLIFLYLRADAPARCNPLKEKDAIAPAVSFAGGEML
jgi:hypothetical protein